MKAHHFMGELNSDPDSPDVEQSLRVVIAYNDVAAGKRAMRVMANLRQRFGDAIAFRLLPWSFDLLTDTGWSEAAVHRAGLDFFAPAPHHELDEAIVHIHQSAEMVTPVLEEILHYHSSAPRPERNVRSQ